MQRVICSCIYGPISSLSNVLLLKSYLVPSLPCSYDRSCRSHSPAWSHIGQSSGWLINKNSTTPFLASSTLSLVILFTTIPSITLVRQLATNFGIGLGSAAEPAATSTKQVRHLPPLPFRCV